MRNPVTLLLLTLATALSFAEQLTAQYSEKFDEDLIYEQKQKNKVLTKINR